MSSAHADIVASSCPLLVLAAALVIQRARQLGQMMVLTCEVDNAVAKFYEKQNRN